MRQTKTGSEHKRHKKKTRRTRILVPLVFLFVSLVFLSSPDYNETIRDIYKQLIEINTTESNGNTTTAAEAMAERLKTAGIPQTDIQVFGPAPSKGNLVARFHGTGRRKPLL